MEKQNKKKYELELTADEMSALKHICLVYWSCGEAPMTAMESKRLYLKIKKMYTGA